MNIVINSVMNNFKIFKESIKDISIDIHDENMALKYYILYLIYSLSSRLSIKREEDIMDFIKSNNDLGFPINLEIKTFFSDLSNKKELKDITSKIMIPSGEVGQFIGIIYSNLQSLIFKKAGGSFYTPKEIIEYLTSKVIDEKQIIKNPYIKILDPACGSGFFLYAIFDQLLKVYSNNIDLINKLHPNLKLSKENIGIHIVKHNLYGMDIDPLGVLITKFGLNEKCNYPIFNQEVNNLNIICGDSLFHSFKEDIEIVIGNPPWVSFGIRGLGKVSKEQREKIKKEFLFSSQYKISYYSLFIEKGIKSLKKGGKLAFITPDSYLLGHYFTNLRKYILSQGFIKEITILGKSIFRGVNAGHETLLIFEKGDNEDKDDNEVKKENYPFILAQWAQDIQALINGKTKRYSYSQGLFYNHKARFYLCFDEESFKMINYLSVIKDKFEDYFGFYSGCIGRYGQKSIITYNKSSEICIRDKQGNLIWQDDKALNCWRPLIETGSNIKPYYITPPKADIYIHPDDKIRKIYGKSGFNTSIYEKPKVLLRQTGDRLIAAYDEEGLFTLNNIHVMFSLKGNTEDLFYALGLLNSNLYNFYYQVISLEKGRIMAQIDLDVIKEMPIIMGTKKQRVELIDLVKGLLSLYRSEENINSKKVIGKINEYRERINHLVYNISGLEGELIQYVDNQNKLIE